MDGKALDIKRPNQISDFAKNLKDLVVKNQLYTNIKGKNYVNVEGWQIAGALLGIYPVVRSLENLSDENTIRYRAEVELKDSIGEVVGCGIAVCTNKETGKSNFEEYAVASMAQTRATGKAFRVRLGFMMKLAGYEATPFEEMVVSEENREAKIKQKLEALDASA